MLRPIALARACHWLFFPQIFCVTTRNIVIALFQSKTAPILSVDRFAPTSRRMRYSHEYGRYERCRLIYLCRVSAKPRKNCFCINTKMRIGGILAIIAPNMIGP